jgi:hypothetical protein
VRQLFKRAPSPSLVISCLALFIALGSVGYAATGGNFILGQGNSAANTTGLSSSVATGPTLNVANGGGKSAARFATSAGVAPFGVTSDTRVLNLNADKLDGIDSPGFVQDADSAGGDLSGPFSNLQLNPNAVTGADIENETITTFDIQSNAIQTDEIEDGTVGAADLGANSVGPSELGDRIVARVGTAVNVPGGAAHNGAYDVGTATAACLAGEELITGTGQWVPDDNASGNHELWIGEIRLNHAAETVIVDGGNDSGVDHSIQAVAHCLS